MDLNTKTVKNKNIPFFVVETKLILLIVLSVTELEQQSSVPSFTAYWQMQPAKPKSSWRVSNVCLFD